MSNPLFNSLNQSFNTNQINPNMDSLKQAYQMFKNSKNPRVLMQMMAQRNPQLQPMIQMLNNGGNPEQIFRSMAQQRGINPDEFIKQFNN